MGDTYKIPEQVLNQLGEHTVGGYALFYFDPDSGFPQLIQNFDSPAHCLAMQKYIGDWISALQALYLENTKMMIQTLYDDAKSGPSENPQPEDEEENHSDE